MVSTVVYESRERHPRTSEMPTPASVERYRRFRGIWRRVRGAEDRHQVELCRELEDGFAAPIHRWAQGESLEDVLRETDMSPGDFVRTCKQVLDLLRQIEEVAPGGGRGAGPARARGGQPRGRRLHRRLIRPRRNRAHRAE